MSKKMQMVEALSVVLAERLAIRYRREPFLRGGRRFGTRFGADRPAAVDRQDD